MSSIPLRLMPEGKVILDQTVHTDFPVLFLPAIFRDIGPLPPIRGVPHNYARVGALVTLLTQHQPCRSFFPFNSTYPAPNCSTALLEAP